MNQCHPLPLHKLLKGQTLFLKVESVGTQNTIEGNECVTPSPRKSGTQKWSARNCVFGQLGGGCETLCTASPSFGPEIPSPAPEIK